MNTVKPYPIDPSYLQQPKPIPLPDIPDGNIVRATQYGMYNRCVEMIEGGMDVNEMDNENVSLLHWATINNRQELVKYYLSKGAHIDVIGGDMKSTPLHWAVRQCLLDMVALLIKHGADPTVVDVEGLTCLHVATQLSHTNIVAYLLATGMSVDLPDKNGLTPLMWSALKGVGHDPTRLLITWGASLNKTDYKGNTAGHYCAISNNYEVMRQLNKGKIDWEIVNGMGQTTRQILEAKKVTFLMNTLDNMMIERGVKKHPNFIINATVKNSQFRFCVMMLSPPLLFVLFGSIFHYSINYWIKLILLVGLVILSRGGTFPFIDSRVQLITIFSLSTCTTFFLCVTYLYTLIRFNNFLVNMSFIVSISFLWYFFVRSAFSDPGYVAATPQQRDEAILSMGDSDPSKRLHLSRFCTTCLIRKPLRSKHCSVCDKCVARFDHHCPWIYNCVGFKNHIYFMGYLLSLIPSLFLFAYGCWGFWAKDYTTYSTTLTFSMKLYKAFVDSAYINPWVFYCFCNSLAYLFWVILLFGSQCFQVFYLNATTNERMNWARYSSMPQFGGTKRDSAPSNQHSHSHLNKSCNKQDSLQKSNNPFNMGIRKHILDFFQTRKFHINWFDTYDLEDFRIRSTRDNRRFYENI